MEYYDYTARFGGKVKKGVTTADDMETAAENLIARGFTVITIAPMQDVFNIRHTMYGMSHRIKKKNIKDFFDQLSFMLGTNLPQNNALLILRDSGVDKKLKYIARLVAEKTRTGMALHEALNTTGFFDVSTIKQLEAGEQSGNVPEALERLVKQYERDLEFSGKIKNAMIYPCLILSVMVIVLWVLMTMVVPALSATLISLGGELPAITQIVIAVSGFVKASTPYMIVGVITAVIMYKKMMKQKHFKLTVDTFKLRLPIIGSMLMKIEMSRFCRNLSAIQDSGIALVPSLAVTQSAIKNGKLKAATEKASKLVEMSGESLSSALAKTRSFPPLMIQLIEVGVNAGRITGILNKIAAQYEKEVDASIKKITGLIEPIMIILVGLLAGTVVMAMYLPILSLVDTMM